MATTAQPAQKLSIYYGNTGAHLRITKTYEGMEPGSRLHSQDETTVPRAFIHDETITPRVKPSVVSFSFANNPSALPQTIA